MARIPSADAPVLSRETRGAPLDEPPLDRRRPRRGVVEWLLLAASAVLVPLTYLRAFGSVPVHALGWDSYTYVWQARAVGSIGLELSGSRPGSAALDSFLQGVLPVSASVQPLITSMALLAALALATAITLGRAMRLPLWTAGLIAAAVGLWGGSGRLAAGYEANLMSLAIFVAATSLVALGGAQWWSFAAAFALVLAADLTHPGLAPVYTAILVGLALLSVPWIVRRARAGERWWRTEPVVGAVVGVAALIGATAILFGLLGQRPSDIADFSAVSALFDRRLAKLPEQLGLTATLIMATAGLGVAWLRRGTRTAEMIDRLGAAWLIGSVAAVVTGAVWDQIPAHRVVFMALPVSALAGLAVAGVAARVAASQVSEPGVIRWLAALGVGITGIVLLASPGLTAFGGYVRAPQDRWEESGRLTTAYVEAVRPTGSIVMIVDQEGPVGSMSPKVFLNATRAGLDPAYLDDFVIYVGEPENALAGRPTLIGTLESDWHSTYDAMSLEAWRSAGPAIASGGVILMPRAAVGLEMYERTAAEHPDKLASDGLLVVRGPVIPLEAPPPPTPLSTAQALALIIATLLVFALVGAGFCLAVTRRLDMGALEAAGWSPAIGVGVCVLTCFTLAAAGGDPSSRSGRLAVGAVALAGYGLALALSRQPARGSP